MSEINWQLIAIIAATSAAVSYLGDSLGMKLGKKRVSLFGLRPKYTSTIITMISGLAVAVITLLVASYTSGQVRHAFFGVNYLNSQISQLTRDVRDRQYQLDETEVDLYSARAEYEKLTAEADALKRDLELMRERRVVAMGGELLAQTSIDAAAGKSELDAAIERLTELAKEHIMESENLVGVNTQISVNVAEPERAMLTEQLASAKGRQVLRMVSQSNIVIGQTVEAAIDAFPSTVIYKKGDLLIEHTAEGGQSPEAAESELFGVLRRLNRRAVSDGVLPDPISGAVGDLASIDFYDTAEKIASMKGPLKIKIFAANDIYTEGPVKVKVVVAQDM